MDLIPLTNEPSSKFEIALEDGNFEIELNFNSISNLWYMDIAQNNVPLISGINLVLGTNLVRGYGLNIGAWFMIDLDSTGVEANVPRLGTKVVLFYIPESELGDISNVTAV